MAEDEAQEVEEEAEEECPKCPPVGCRTSFKIINFHTLKLSVENVDLITS